MSLTVGSPPARPEGPVEAERGEVFTRPWVVDLVLDLAGYTPEKDLAVMSAVEPACGAGAFLGSMVDRLVASCELHGRSLADAGEAIRAYDLSKANVAASRALVTRHISESEVSSGLAALMAATWINTGDFLLEGHAQRTVDFVLGNPPYIRLENVKPSLSAAYRRVCTTMRGRSDVFVGFIELGLRLLAPGGALGFIVADRWMRNQYGAGLRSLVTNAFAVDAVIEMHDVDAFEEPVAAYPAITVIRREAQGSTVLAAASRSFGQQEAERLGAWAIEGIAGPLNLGTVTATRSEGWFSGDDPWPSGTPEQLSLLADLSHRFPPLEDKATGTRVGIGLATGADDLFLTTDPQAVEAERLLPMAMAKDLAGGRVAWQGTYLVNPWDEEGLVDLEEWPQLRRHFERHRARIEGRHTARKSPSRWYRTIDRVMPELACRPKLLLPEIKAAAHPVLEEGLLYPHHNLYHVISSGWDLEVLGGLMLSEVANLFVGAYCVKLRGGTYRFQAQYLRRIRVPPLDRITAADGKALASAFAQRDVEAATAAAVKLYGLEALPSTRRRQRRGVA